jgi:hypothetical protein
MESPAEYGEFPMDGDDIAYPCKGCGEVRKASKDLFDDADMSVMVDLGGRKGL